MQIKNNVFVVTGGGSGLGAATARMIVAKGGKVVLADGNKEAGAAVAAELGANARFVFTDVANEESAQGAFAAAVEMGTLRGLVNCAGIAPAEKVVGKEGAHKLESFARTININLVGSFNMIRLAAEIMGKAEADEQGERGVIVSTASVAAFHGQLGQAAYAASKGGCAGMVLPLARELGEYGIRVMGIAPGVFETPMTLNLAPASRDVVFAAVPPFPRRAGRAEEFAALALSIIGNPMLNGEVIRLDGALRMPARL
jgi:NAD(P)-dependent dehydrogenase (short-subunit alcohol dehydrogenase family)